MFEPDETEVTKPDVDEPTNPSVVIEPKPTYGIKETAEAVKFACVVANAIATFKEVPWTAQASKIFPLIESGVSGISGAAEIPKEIADLDEKEIADLVQTVRQNFDIPNDQLEAAIEDSIAVISALVSLAGRFKTALA